MLGKLFIARKHYTRQKIIKLFNLLTIYLYVFTSYIFTFPTQLSKLAKYKSVLDKYKLSSNFVTLLSYNPQ